MNLNELSQKMAPPNGDQLLWEIYRAFTHAGKSEPHSTFLHLVNALQLLVSQSRLLSGTPGLDYPTENGAMLTRGLLPPVPGMMPIRKRRAKLGGDRPSVSDQGASA